MSTNSHDPRHTAIARAESEALALQAAEDVSAQRFEDVRLQLVAADAAEGVTRAPEFHDWMAARARTDEAWGRWALAMDAVHG